MVNVVAERRVVLLLVAEAVERLDIRAAVGAVDPGHRGTPLELRDLRGVGQGVAHAEQRFYVDAVVDWGLGGGHVVPPRCDCWSFDRLTYLVTPWDLGCPLRGHCRAQALPLRWSADCRNVEANTDGSVGSLPIEVR